MSAPYSCTHRAIFCACCCCTLWQQCGGIQCSGLLTSPHYVVNPQSSKSIMAAHSLLIGTRLFARGHTTRWVCEDEKRRRRARLQSEDYRRKHQTGRSSFPLTSLLRSDNKKKKKLVCVPEGSGWKDRTWRAENGGLQKMYWKPFTYRNGLNKLFLLRRRPSVVFSAASSHSNHSRWHAALKELKQPQRNTTFEASVMNLRSRI